MASFSFNEAAYPGINLRGYILKLLLSFFTKLYVFWGNIRKAFLMIKLSSEEDKNRFCLFFWRSVITLFVFIIPLSYLGLMYPYSFKIMFWNIMLLSSLLMHAYAVEQFFTWPILWKEERVLMNQWVQGILHSDLVIQKCTELKTNEGWRISGNVHRVC